MKNYNRERFLKEFKQVIETNDNIAIFHHKNIDGDSLSSSIGLALALIKKYPAKSIKVVTSPVELKLINKTYSVNTSMIVESIDDTYIGIVGDTSSKDMMNAFSEFEKTKIKICFDHHQNEPNTTYDLFWKESGYPASALQAYEIAEYLQVEFDEEIAFHLMIGIYTDTGAFGFSGSNVMPVQYYANLLKYISNDRMSKYFTVSKLKTKQDLELQKDILNNVHYFNNISYVLSDKEMTKKYGFFTIKKYINTFGNIEGYNIWALFCYEEDMIKSEYRSTGPNVGEFAKSIGGGGHIRASGASLPIDTPIESILERLSKIE